MFRPARRPLQALVVALLLVVAAPVTLGLLPQARHAVSVVAQDAGAKPSASDSYPKAEETAAMKRLTPEERDARNREMVRGRVTFAFSMVFALMAGYLLFSHQKNRKLLAEVEFLSRRVSQLEGGGHGGDPT